MTTKEEALRNGGRALAVARVERDARSSRAAAEAAWYRGHPLGSVEAIEALIVSQREQALAAHNAQHKRPLAA